MTGTRSNPYIEFLTTYGPSAASDSLCDENVRLAAERFGIQPVEAPPSRMSDLVDAILSESPRNVILTGTAGDGKTYHIRRFLFGQNIEGFAAVPDWIGSDTVLRMSLGADVELRVIRDLSEMSPADKAEELEELVASLLGEEPRRIYLMAANDGQLLMYFRDAMNSPHLSEDRRLRCRTVFETLSDMMRSEAEVDDRLSLRLLNLSRSWSVETVDTIFNGLLEHPAWDRGCSSCIVGGEKPTCPILRNRALLREPPGVRSMFRIRIREVLELAAANERHVPIRQLFTLLVNLLLGDRKRPSEPLLTCSRARSRAARGDYQATNPYDNVVGLNLAPEQRRASGVFQIFEMLGIGYETNNLVDSLMLHRKPEAAYRDLFEDGDQTYGMDLFAPSLRLYMSGQRDAASQFLRSLQSQRRRAFFVLKADGTEGRVDPWQLTIFHHGNEYLDILRSTSERPQQIRLTKALVRGLNRVYTGMMTKTDERLWLAGTIGKTDNPVGRMSLVEPLERSGGGLFGLRLDVGPAGRRPGIAVTTRSSSTRLPELALRPHLFEYLMRVAGGSLPATFSRQCHQEVRHFALSATEALRSADEGATGSHIRILSLGSTGELIPNVVEV